MNTAVAGSPDTTPPTTPLNFLAGTSGPTSIPVSWTASNDDRGVDRYDLFVNGQPAGSTTATTFTFTGLTCSTSYTLGVEARDAAGNHSGRATRGAQTAACDTTSPEIMLTAPAAGAEVSGTTSVAATATDNDAVAGVQFLLDGAPLGSEDMSAPYFMSWNTRSVSNGPHVITARARDRSGNERLSERGRDHRRQHQRGGRRPRRRLRLRRGRAARPPATRPARTTTARSQARPGRRAGAIGAALDFDGVNDIVTSPTPTRST